MKEKVVGFRGLGLWVLMVVVLAAVQHYLPRYLPLSRQRYYLVECYNQW